MQAAKAVTTRLVLLTAGALTLAAGCGGGGGNDDPAPGTSPAPPTTGTLSGGITDAAVDDLLEVNLKVTALELHQSDDDAEPVTIDLTDPDTGDPMTFNLLDYQNGETLELFDAAEVPAGTYEQVRLVLVAPAQTPNECDGQDPRLGSYVVERQMNTENGIFVPSGANNGVRLNTTFDVPAGG